MTPAPVLWLHVGDPRHGVNRFGRVLAAARPPGRSVRQADLPAPGDHGSSDLGEVASMAERCAAVITQFTDRQWGADPDLAAARFEAVADALGSALLVVGLHDVPTADEAGRRAAYARVARRCGRTVVCSEHERRRLLDMGVVDVTVVPHPVERRRPPRSSARPSGGDAGVLGFVYPGKGHGDLLVAAARSTSRPAVLVLGGAAPGHEDLVADLALRAEALGVPLRTTGWVHEAALVSQAEQVAVPVVPNCAPSASGSLATWLSVGRRPLVRDSEYAREVADLVPGAIGLYCGADPDALAAELDAAAADPGSTLGPGVPDRLRPERIALRWTEIAEGAP